MIKWLTYPEEKPKKSGFYFVIHHRQREIAYYDAVLDLFLWFEYEYTCFYDLGRMDNLQWGKMPRYSRSKLLNNETIKL